jgi:hypothetical protein
MYGTAQRTYQSDYRVYSCGTKWWIDSTQYMAMIECCNITDSDVVCIACAMQKNTGGKRRRTGLLGIEQSSCVIPGVPISLSLIFNDRHL